MARPANAVFGRISETVRGFSLAQKTIAIIGVAVLALGITLLVSWTTKPAYTPLFSGLAASDANTLVEQLKTDGVPYEIANGGGTILVPEASVYDQRLKAAGAGLPSSSTGGYSLLDEMGVTSSEFQQSVTYKRALEGELAKTVGALDGVKAATVQLAIPEDTVFVSEKGDPTASVFVETENGVTLGTDQIQAIVHLTSASIDGMDATNVAVIDSAGTVLSAVGVGATGSADKQSSDYEKRVGTSVQTMLDRVVGPGNATVAVAADMNYESANRVEESFTSPENGPALNEATTTEEYTGGNAGGAAGVLGPDNIAVPGDANGDGTFNSETSTRNNAVNKVTETRDIPAGALNRQTVSVALNTEAAAGLNLDNLEALVATAAGINAERGDQLTVEMVAFNAGGAAAAQEALAAAAEAAEAEREARLLNNIILATGIVMAVVLALVAYAMRSRRQNREAIDIGELPELDPLAPATKLAMIGQNEPATTAISIPTDTAGLPILAAGPNSTDRKRAEVDVLAGQDPARTAEYLRTFMDEGQPV